MEVARSTFPVGIVGAVLAVGGVIAYSLAPDKLWLVTLCEGLALVCLIIFFVIHIESLKTFSTKRSTRMGTNSLLMVVLFAGILGIVNFLGARHSQRWDFSETQRFTLAPQTHRVLRNLNRDVKLLVFTQERSPAFNTFKDLLGSYRQASTRLTVELIDPERHPNLAREYGITKLDTVIIESGSQTLRANGASEAELTGALIRVTKETKKRILFLDGHGERSTEDRQRGGLALTKEALMKQGYDIDTLTLLQERSVPENTAVLVIAGPRRPVTQEEKGRIRTFVSSGGHLLILLDPESPSDLDDLLKGWGVEAGRGVVVDLQDKLAQGELTSLLVRRFVQHEITQELKSFLLFPESRFIREFPSQDWDFQPIAQTSPQSRAVLSHKGSVFSFNDKEDILGPLSLAAVVTMKKPPEEGKPRPSIVVVGNSLFASNAYINLLGNPDFFLNTISWLAQEPELISITPKEEGFKPFLPNPAQEAILLSVQVLFLPLATFVWGMLVWRKRRRL